MLTGASGLLGGLLQQFAPRDVEVVSVVHRRDVAGPSVVADLRERDAVEDAFATVRPSLVIHAGCARDEASIVDATNHVAAGAVRMNARLVFVSSEAVFSGDGRRRSETSRPDPVWDYGRWKSEAEVIARSHDPGAVIVRLPLIVSSAPEDHIVTDIRRGHESGERSVWFTDEIRQPAHGDELARAIWSIAALSASAQAGAWHLPGPERRSRFEIATRAVAVLGLDQSSIVATPTPHQSACDALEISTSQRHERSVRSRGPLDRCIGTDPLRLRDDGRLFLTQLPRRPRRRTRCWHRTRWRQVVLQPPRTCREGGDGEAPRPGLRRVQSPGMHATGSDRWRRLCRVPSG